MTRINSLHSVRFFKSSGEKLKNRFAVASLLDIKNSTKLQLNLIVMQLCIWDSNIYI